MGNRTATLPLGRLSGVRVDQVVQESLRGRRTTKYQLESSSSDGPLLRDWNHREPLEFVAEVLRSAVASRPVTRAWRRVAARSGPLAGPAQRGGVADHPLCAEPNVEAVTSGWHPRPRRVRCGYVVGGGATCR